MLGLSALELSRIQFGFTISFPIIFPAITIGLASYLAVLEALFAVESRYDVSGPLPFLVEDLCRQLAMGVVSGLVMAYQFGTNWSHFSAFAGSITGPFLTYEVLTAFFLEAAFLPRARRATYTAPRRQSRAHADRWGCRVDPPHACWWRHASA
jgi:cytochrome bd ubiquinol oxidase subunit I